MARTISKAMSDIIQELELENTVFVDLNRIEELCERYSVGTSPAMVALRLKKKRLAAHYFAERCLGVFSRCSCRDIFQA